MTEIAEETLFSSNTQAENEQLTILKRHFPNCFNKQGAFLPEKMAEALQSNSIKTEKESYSLNWLGKSYAKILKDRQPETLLAEDIEHNQKPENQNSENILIQGDNLEVLKHLKHAYKNQIKMIYIDPPYNTGSDGFVYQDDRKFTPQQLVELGMDLEEAERVLEFTAKKSNSHSAWLTFMYPRLYIARELLRDDGVIFISIDDNEQAQLKLLCDEVFGEENFVEVFSWVKTSTPPSLSTKSRKTNEYILCYEKCKDNYKYNAGQQDEGDEPLLNSGNTERILEFPSDSLTFKFIENGHLKAGKFDKVTLMNDIQIVNFKSTTPVLLSGEFKWVQDTLTEEIKKGTTFVAKTIKLSIRFLRTEKGFKRPTNFIKDEIITPLIDKKDTNVDTNEKATQEILDIFAKPVFTNPKPLSLIKYLANFKVLENDLILDFFAGSGTTAHAVMQLNAEDKGNRKFICVQLPEPTDEKSEAYKAGYKTIFDITKARIEKSAVKIRQDFKETTADLGFKIFKTEPHFQTALNTDFDPQIDFLPKTDLNDKQLHTLLTTWRVFDGCRLPEKVQNIDLVGYTAYYCRQHLYLLASGFTSENVKALIERLDNDKDFVPERIVLFGENIDSVMQKELAQAVKTYANKKGLNNLSVLARY
ncbi:site-specific DNA-methyltransferase [Haemophilus haemolyticus]|uniref:site-specific DNA-methyltransferase n=1 Tax=Haemophilus haemolyticus TaxID=726 RepID=UPI000E57EE52|nr:site-specific DNA-methyltransferase [Haemophilus haemolyticus]